VKFKVAPSLPAPVKFANWTEPAPEPSNVPAKPPLRLTTPPVPALMIALLPLPPPVRARVPELPATVPEPLTGKGAVVWVPETVPGKSEGRLQVPGRSCRLTLDENVIVAVPLRLTLDEVIE